MAKGVWHDYDTKGPYGKQLLAPGQTPREIGETYGLSCHEVNDLGHSRK